MKPTLLVLAAGIGSRYGGLKQVDGIGPSGEAILEYSVYDAIRAGFGRVVFVIRKEIEVAFKEKFIPRFGDKIEVAFVEQKIDSPVDGINQFPIRQKPWGTGHAILVAKELIHEPFAVINADDYYGVSAFPAMANFLKERCQPDHYCMVGYVLKNTLSDIGTVSRGVCDVDENFLLTEVIERTQVQRIDQDVYHAGDDGVRHLLQEDALVSMNLWGFHPNIFDTLTKQFITFVEQRGHEPKSEFYIPTVVSNELHAKNIKVTVLPNQEYWYGITYKEDKDRVAKAFLGLTKSGKYPTSLWE